jgi:signal peptidase I
MPWTDHQPEIPLNAGIASEGQSSLLRQLSESIVILAIAVLSFREFAAEGYLISTGSMAPFLLGYHRQVECPHCHYQFAAGLAPSEIEHSAGEAVAQDLYGDESIVLNEAMCPNCGLEHISTDRFPENEGDQLMVHKHAYQFRDPRRWEVIVFHNPADPLQAYVKRVVGLPGETVRIVDGDVYIGNEIQRKPLEAQRGIGILVDDHSRQPDESADPEWRPRWVPERDHNGWNNTSPAIQFEPSAENAEATSGRFNWIDFRHWVRSGGHHVSTVPLENWPNELGHPPGPGLALSVTAGGLSCTGVLSDDEVRRWSAMTSDKVFHAALDQLAELSHEAPIVDDYGYNRHVDGASSFVVRDLMVSLDAEPQDHAGVMAIEIDDGRKTFRAEIDFDENTARLLCDGQEVAGAVSFEVPKEKPAIHLEFSVMDRQCLLGINGTPLFPAFTYEGNGRDAAAPRRPIRIGARAGAFTVSQLQVTRDVYYTPKSEPREPKTLGEDEFFVLGDNSPVSIDSRCWDDPAVHRGDLVGRPFVVHLPSRQARVSLFGSSQYVRVPDFSRVRYIR